MVDTLLDLFQYDYNTRHLVM